jgi:enamine deaminase RidA (YjgF/YER057c/UK114 family)
MNYSQYKWDELPVKINVSKFNSENVSEFHLMMELTDAKIPTVEQFNLIDHATDRLKKSPEFAKAVWVWKRYFVSDAANQGHLIPLADDAAVSIIQQSPLNGTKLSLWAYFVEDISLARSEDGTFVLHRPNYTHLYHTQIHDKNGNSYQQTQSVFQQYIRSLKKHQCSLEANCLRTWLFVQDVDIQYGGLVRARRELFAELGMTPQTHYIASTGIEGRHVQPETLVAMDAYAIREITKEQISYLHGASHLNPTHEYGVTFERGTALQFGDRRHVFISGTASINNKGNVVYPYDIVKQTERALENVQVLLQEAGADMNDIAHLIIYLRDTADYENTRIYFEKHYPEIPKVILLAPVCRPGWLVEIECMAIITSEDLRFKPF